VWFGQALFEAQLYQMIPDSLRQSSFNRFRSALNARLDQSAWLVRLDLLEPKELRDEEPLNLATTSIICFSVMVAQRDGSRRALDEAECRKIFELLNIDVSDKLGQLSPGQRSLARIQAHIGQPVFLQSQDGGRTALRLVLGARFFGIVAHAGPGSQVHVALCSGCAVC
jgi:hypothetical protein